MNFTQVTTKAAKIEAKKIEAEHLAKDKRRICRETEIEGPPFFAPSQQFLFIQRCRSMPFDPFVKNSHEKRIENKNRFFLLTLNWRSATGQSSSLFTTQTKNQDALSIRKIA